MRTLVFLGLCLATISGFAQEASQLVPRRLLLSVSLKKGSTFTSGDALMIARSLHQRLQEADSEVVVLESSHDTGSMTLEELGALAGKVGADSWMQVTLDGGWTSAHLGIRAFDLLSNSMVADFSATRTSWGSPGSLPQETWQDAAQAIAGKFPMVESAAPPATGEPLASLTITALPGSVVTGLGKQPLRIESNGSASRMLPVAREYSLRTSLPGYVPVTQRIFLSGDREVAVSQVQSSKWGWEVSLGDTRAPGFDLTISLPAQSVFLRFGVMTYALGFDLSSTGFFLNDPLTNVVLQAGTYLSPEDRFFRFYLGLGAFARVVHAKGTTPVLDQLAPVGLRIFVGTEVPVSSRGRMYFEYTPSVYQTSAPDAFRAAFGPDNVPGWIFGHSAALNVLSFRFGYRWQL